MFSKKNFEFINVKAVHDKDLMTLLEQLNVLEKLKDNRIILDMDSSESPVYGEQEGAAYNGHFQSVCYHPLFLFNHFGDCEGALLRSGNVHSADSWQQVRNLSPGLL